MRCALRIRPLRRRRERAAMRKASPSRSEQMPILRLAERLAFASMALEHRLQLDRRTADDLSTSAVAVCCSSDSLRSSCAPQLVEQPRVLDRDHGLSGELLDQLDLLVGERPHLVAADQDGAERACLREQRDARECCDVRDLRASCGQRILGSAREVGKWTATALAVTRPIELSHGRVGTAERARRSASLLAEPWLATTR